jgi:hypothetical protein
VFGLTIEDSGGQGQTLIGTPGNDVLAGSPFDDSLDGRGGADRLAAQAGDDVLQFFADGRWGLLGFARHAGSRSVQGTGELAWLAGKNRSHDLFDGGEGFDMLLGTAGHDALFLHDRLSPPDGYTGPRISAIESIATGAGNDIVDLTSPRHAYGDVMLDGGDGNDTLWASWGNDVLSGGPGDDRLSGGAGRDVYLHEARGGKDVITEAGTSGVQDVLRFGEGITQQMVTARRHYGDLVLDAGLHGSVTVKGWFSSSAQRIERIEFADGSSWEDAYIRERAGDSSQHCQPHEGQHRHSDDHHGGGRKDHERHEERRDNRGTPEHDRVNDLITMRLSSVPRLDFEKVFEEFDRPTERVRDALDIARHWQAVAAYASALGAESDVDDGAPMAWPKADRLGGAAWGFEGSVGAGRGPAEFEALEGLREGFRKL